MKTAYFTPTPTTLEELKKMYRELAKIHHPDKGGTDEAMKAVNCEYDRLFPLLKDTHKNKDGETYTKSNAETADHFKGLIAELMKMDNLIIEIIGCFVRVTGETKPYKDQLKALNFQWHRKKTAWYLKPEDYQIRSRQDYSLDAIRAMYGSSGEYHSAGTVKLNTAGAV